MTGAMVRVMSGMQLVALIDVWGVTFRVQPGMLLERMRHAHYCPLRLHLLVTYI
jgi:hypothetical protein